MKFFIVGKQGSGKLEILNILEKSGLKVAREFSNLPELPPQIYMDPQYLKYPSKDVDTIFDTGAYLCIGPIEETGILDGYKYYRGISHYTYDQASALVLTPQQISNINRKVIKDTVVFVWLDNNRDERIHYHCEHNRTHDFVEQEGLESLYDADFVKTIYNFPNSKVLYFTNEVPERVATIIMAIEKHPDLLQSFVENFN